MIRRHLTAGNLDVVIGRLKLAEGDGVLCSLVAADHDERMFPDAGRFDVRRDASAHLAFGHGVHQCLGQPLARGGHVVIRCRVLLVRATGWGYQAIGSVRRPWTKLSPRKMFAAQTTG